jgi:hypothetical protein
MPTRVGPLEKGSNALLPKNKEAGYLGREVTFDRLRGKNTILQAYGHHLGPVKTDRWNAVE